MRPASGRTESAGQQNAARSIEIGLDGVFALVEFSCDLADGSVFNVVHPNEGLLVLAQEPFHGLTQLFETLGAFVFVKRSGVGRSWRQRFCAFVFHQGHRGVSLPLETVGYNASGDSEQPSRKNAFSTKRVQAGQDAYEDFLGDLFDIGSISHTPGNEAIDPLEVAFVEQVESTFVAVCDSGQQFLIGRRRIKGRLRSTGSRIFCSVTRRTSQFVIPLPSHR